MPSFHVRFKGMLTQIERRQLAAAGVELVDSEALVAGGVAVGRPIFTAMVEADSADRCCAGGAGTRHGQILGLGIATGLKHSSELPASLLDAPPRLTSAYVKP
jgi:hypothetical protein